MAIPLRVSRATGRSPQGYRTKAACPSTGNVLDHAAQYQKELAVSIEETDAGKKLASMLYDLKVSEMPLEEMDADLEESTSYAARKATDAKARGDMDSYKMWEEAVINNDNQRHRIPP